MTAPTKRILSLGAGVQSTALFLLSCEGIQLPKVDAAVFADTKWEPRHVMTHLAKLQQYGEEHGVPVYLASRGSLPLDTLNTQVFATIPAWTRSEQWEEMPVEWTTCPECRGRSPFVDLRDLEELDDYYGDPGEDDPLPDGFCAVCQGQQVVPSRYEQRLVKTPAGRIKRQCTPKYKIEVIDQQVRLLLGATEYYEPCRFCGETGQRIAPWEPLKGVHECSICRGTGQRRRVSSVPAGAVSEQWVGFSTDEIERVTTAGFPSYEQPRHPLLELGWSRTMCEDYLTAAGWQAEKSACIGCPFHDDNVWIDMKHRDPEDFQDAVDFDENPAFRNGSGMASQRFLHEARIPLREAVEKAEALRALQGQQMPLWGQLKRPTRRGCSPYGCRTSQEQDEPGLDEVIEIGRNAA